jgi:hypothetical protein
MLEIYKSSGRKPEIPPEIQQTLINELKFVGIHQYKYDYLGLYGLVEPISGENFFEEWSHLNGDCLSSLSRFIF